MTENINLSDSGSAALPFRLTGPLEILTVRRQNVRPEDVRLLAWSDVRKRTAGRNIDPTYCWGVHFFLADERFHGVVRDPAKYAPQLAEFSFTLTPDCSVYADLPRRLQIANTAANRRCGVVWQQMGPTVITTVSWGLIASFDFCFEGIEPGAAVAVSTVGCRRFDGRRFMRGYRTMCETLSPSCIICYGRPFPGMTGPLS